MLPAYGMRIAFDGEAGADVRVHPPDSDPRVVESAWSGPQEPRAVALRMVDGLEVIVERGRDGDVRFDWGGAGRWWIDPAATRVLCWAPAEPDAAWWRMLLDFVRGSVALARGAEALHAGAVVVEGRAVALAAGQGGGKTSLVAELMRRGHPLLADDVLVVDAAPGAEVIAHAGPPLMNLAAPRPFPPAAEDLGRVLAHIGGEDWVLVERSHPDAAPLAAVVLLDRGDADEVRVDAMQASPAPLLGLFLQSGSGPGRRLARFDAISALAERVPLLGLSAPLEGAPPQRLADALLEALP